MNRAAPTEIVRKLDHTMIRLGEASKRPGLSPQDSEALRTLRGHGLVYFAFARELAAGAIKQDAAAEENLATAERFCEMVEDALQE